MKLAISFQDDLLDQSELMTEAFAIKTLHDALLLFAVDDSMNLPKYRVVWIRILSPT